VLLARITGRGEHRADDSEAVARHRLAVYRENTEPLIDYYTGRGIIIKIDAAPPVDTVTHEIFEALDRIAGEKPA
jgi:adenylate kinase